jgi:hypothetical protein
MNSKESIAKIALSSELNKVLAPTPVPLCTLIAQYAHDPREVVLEDVKGLVRPFEDMPWGWERDMGVYDGKPKKMQVTHGTPASAPWPGAAGVWFVVLYEQPNPMSASLFFTREGIDYELQLCPMQVDSSPHVDIYPVPPGEFLDGVKRDAATSVARFEEIPAQAKAPL